MFAGKTTASRRVATLRGLAPGTHPLDALRSRPRQAGCSSGPPQSSPDMGWLGVCRRVPPTQIIPQQRCCSWSSRLRSADAAASAAHLCLGCQDRALTVMVCSTACRAWSPSSGSDPAFESDHRILELPTAAGMETIGKPAGIGMDCNGCSCFQTLPPSPDQRDVLVKSRWADVGPASLLYRPHRAPITVHGACAGGSLPAQRDAFLLLCANDPS